MSGGVLLPRARSLLVAVTLVGVLVAQPAPTASGQTSAPVTGEHAGDLPNGTSWRAVVPEDWNGTLLLYSRGYYPGFLADPNPVQIAPDEDTEQALLERGYALVGSSYSAKGWPLDTALGDQLDTLDEAVAAIGAEPERVVAHGSSMGGLVTGQLAEQAGGEIDGALAVCGLMAGAVGLANHQLDASHAIDQLLAPDEDIKLVGYTSFAEAFAAAAALNEAVDDAQQSPEGRARSALAAALLHVPDWPSGEAEPNPWEWDAIHDAQHGWMGPTLTLITAGRFDLESSAGGNVSWNAGVDYLDLLVRSDAVGHIRILYHQAGLTDLHIVADLMRLTQTADVEADPDAVDALRQTSTLSGDPQVPVLTLHNTDDNIAPVEHESAYLENVLASGDGSLVQQAFVGRPDHCELTPAEWVASLQALEGRLDTGHWGSSTTWWALNAAAGSLELGESAFVPYLPSPFLGRVD